VLENNIKKVLTLINNSDTVLKIRRVMNKVMIQKALKRFKISIEAWKNTKTDDIEMIKAYKKDGEDLQAVYNFIQEDDLKTAGIAAYNLDTIVRDQIPKNLYNEIMDAVPF
jgi:hypothetical protein